MAGRSNRMKPIMKEPKCLMAFGDKKLIDIQLECLFEFKIKDIVLILGYKGQAIEKYLKNKYPDKKFRFIYNKKWAESNNLVSLLAAKPFLRKETLVLHCDVLFPKELIGQMIRQKPEGALLTVQKKACGNEEMKFILDEKNEKIALLTKKIPPDKADGEYMGICSLSEEFGEKFIETFSKMPYSYFKDNYYDWGIQLVGQMTGLPLDILDATHLPMMEIDFPEDYKKAKKDILPKVIAFNKTYEKRNHK